MKRGVVSLSVALVALLLTGPAGGSNERLERDLGPEQSLVVLVFPLELALTAAYAEPMLGVELRGHVGSRWVLTARPLVVWYLPQSVGRHGYGLGGRAGVHYYLTRPLAGPFLGLQGGLVEALVGSSRGRMFGGTLSFGFARTWPGGNTLSLGLGFGYWHRQGAIRRGAGIPEVLSLELGLGWGR